MNETQYTLLVLEAYEDEVAGAAYFEGLALAYPHQSRFLQKCAMLERSTANRLLELVRKYQLTPSAKNTLQERGARDARMEAASDWETLVHQSIKLYARYVAEFQALEAMGPIEDHPILAAVTAHEIQLIEWMQAEAGLYRPQQRRQPKKDPATKLASRHDHVSQVARSEQDVHASRVRVRTGLNSGGASPLTEDSSDKWD